MSDRPAWVLDAAGNRRLLKPGEVLKSGERLQVSMHHMDSTVLPEAQQISDEQRVADAAAAAQAARDEMIRSMNDSWKQPVPSSTEIGTTAAVQHVDAAPTEYADAASAHEAYCRQLAEGWRS